MNKALSVFAVGSTLFVLVAACDKKEEATAVDAEVAPVATPSTTETAAAEADAAAPLDTTETAGGGGGGGGTGTGGGTGGNKPTNATGDKADSGGAQQCCCDVKGKLSHLEMSECTKGQKGQCVKKEKCEAAEAAAAKDAGAVQQCCCDTAGKKELRGQSECTKGKKGKCVKMTECKS